MIDAAPRNLAVLGSPIAHSLSPPLHRAAYEVLGLPWNYEALDITGERLAEFVNTRTPQWRGLSLTMPLKRDVLPLLDSLDPAAALSGVANTLLFDDGARRGYNTDIDGIIRSFAANGTRSLSRVAILGGGATATSALVAVARMGAEQVGVTVRTPSKAAGLVEVGERLGVGVVISGFSEIGTSMAKPDAIISTLPNGSEVDIVYPQSVRESAVLFDVAYDPWPTGLAESWRGVGGTVIPGIEMLINQALVQVRIFTSGNPESPLPNEKAVLTAMETSVLGT